MSFIVSVYNLVKTIVCKYEPNAVNDFMAFEAVLNAMF